MFNFLSVRPSVRVNSKAMSNWKCSSIAFLIFVVDGIKSRFQSVGVSNQVPVPR